MKEKIVKIYENIYNRELEWKNSLDNKFSSRLTIFITITTATFIVFTTVFFTENVCEEQYIELLIMILSCISMCFWIFQGIFFYMSFFRFKKNYKVMPTVEIRMFHFYIHRNNLCGKQSEEDLYDYLNDSYQFCAFSNACINSKRESSLIKLDNISVVEFVLLITIYILMRRTGYCINWIF